MENLEKHDVFAFHLTQENFRSVSWGPNNLLAVATENIVTIYQCVNNELVAFRRISRHKALITSLCWNFPSVEFNQNNSFDIFLAVGDQAGNCLVYEIFSLTRRAGISADQSNSISIIDLKFSLNDPSTLFILTSQPSLISVAVGTNTSLQEAKTSSVFIHGLSFLTLNINLLWTHPLESQYHMISLDLYNHNTILISSKKLDYFALKIDNTIKNNPKNTLSSVLRFPIDDTSKLLSCEFFPFRPNTVLLLTEHSLYIYNLFNLSISIIISDSLHTFCLTKGIFSHQNSENFWLATIDGTISQYEIDEENDCWINRNCISSVKSQILTVASDFYHPSRICVVYSCGRITIVQNHDQINQQYDQINQNRKIIEKNRLFVSFSQPGLNEILSWHVFNRQLAVLSNNGYVTIFIDNKKLRFQVNDSQSTILSFYNSHQIIVNGSKLHLIDLETREIKHIDKNIPKDKIVSKMILKDDIIAYLPSPSTLELYTINGSSLIKDFAYPIKLFCPCSTDKEKWALLLSKSNDNTNEALYTLTIIGFPTPKNYEIDSSLGSIVSISFSDNWVYFATSRSIIQQFDITNGAKKNVVYSLVSMRSISIYKNYLIAVDMSNSCSILSLSDMKIVSTKILKGKELQILNDECCLLLSGKSVIKLYKFPSLENHFIDYSFNQKDNQFSLKFQCCRTSDDFEKVAFEIGDINFVQFLQNAKRKSNTILPALYSLTHEKVVSNERCVCASTKNSISYIDDYIEYLILTGQREKSAKVALSTINKQNILLAHACFSPNYEAVQRIMEIIPIDGSEKVLTLLLCIADRIQDASQLALKLNDTLTIIRFTKLMINDEKMENEIIKKFKSCKRSYTAMAYIQDYHATISVLAHLKEISKAKAYLTFIEEKKQNVEKSSIDDDFPPFEETKKWIDSEWANILQKDLFV
ncbi:hypothetical protein TRFO_13043 [Tritrichomonas foetus]|uniref:Uncharacterized protein n=1 Tax=Tritrichomonas foetus TaxID=1144522 RepID=A0A1J4KZE1_9EUKA|nr:hypothetical protein TRFO_13043 [Tritrichomonas foetus]|eukprot:OHT16625.1 hypothetical protein TRFO_13043 [Tritrichomonas foetus]